MPPTNIQVQSKAQVTDVGRVAPATGKGAKIKAPLEVGLAIRSNVIHILYGVSFLSQCGTGEETKLLSRVERALSPSH